MFSHSEKEQSCSNLCNGRREAARTSTAICKSQDVAGLKAEPGAWSIGSSGREDREKNECAAVKGFRRYMTVSCQRPIKERACYSRPET